MSNIKLTYKQELFCQSVTNGETLKDAYMRAYSAQSMSMGALYVEAHRLATNPKITLRIEQLRAELAQVTNWTRAQSVQALIEVLGTAKEQGKFMAMIGAIKALNSMHGFDKPEVLNNQAIGGVIFNIEYVEPQPLKTHSVFNHHHLTQ